MTNNVTNEISILNPTNRRLMIPSQDIVIHTDERCYDTGEACDHIKFLTYRGETKLAKVVFDSQEEAEKEFDIIVEQMKDRGINFITVNNERKKELYVNPAKINMEYMQPGEDVSEYISRRLEEVREEFNKRGSEFI